MLNANSLSPFIKVNCGSSDDKLLYYISVPINYSIKFVLYHLISIPTFVKSDYFSVVPAHRHILKEDNSETYFALTKPCKKLATTYQCDEATPISSESCSTRMISTHKSTGCPIVAVNINHSYIEPIPETNQVLLCLPKLEHLEFYCTNKVEKRNLQGIFLFSSTSCDIMYEGSFLPKNLNTTGELTMSDFFISNITMHTRLPFNLTLEHLQLNISPELIKAAPGPVNSLLSLDVPTHFSILYILCSVLATLFVIFTIYFCVKREVYKPVQTEPTRSDTFTFISPPVSQPMVQPTIKPSVIPMIDFTKLTLPKSSTVQA